MAAGWTRHGLLDGFGLSVPTGLQIDAYWHWLNLPGAAGTPAGNLASFVLRFDTADVFQNYQDWLRSGEPRSAAKARPEPYFDLPSFYLDRELPRAASFPKEIVVFSRPDVLPLVVEGLRGELAPGRIFSDVRAVGAPRHPDLPQCAPTEQASAMLSPRPRPKRIVAIIDTDIAFAHERFRWPREDPDTPSLATRIAWYWDMDADCETRHGLAIGREMFARPLPGVSADRFLFIDDLLGRFATAGAVDEPALYAFYQARSYGAGARRRAIRATGHGTHVLDVAAGAPASGHDVSEVPIFAVQLPRLVVEDTHGTYLSAYVQLALDRIEYLAETWPGDGDTEVLVNFSFGGSAGRHDGGSQLEQDFDRRIAEKSVAGIFLPAGNSYLSQTHARFSGAELRAEQRLTLRVQPDDGTPNFAQIWLPRMAGAEAALQLEVSPPAGQPLRLNLGGPAMEAGTFWELATASGQVLARLYIQFDGWPPGAADERLKITLAIHHTAQHHAVPGHGAGEPDMAGNWGLTLASDQLDDTAEVMLWVERDDALNGARTRALQSYLVRTDPDLAAPPAPGVRRDGTISDIGTGARTTVMAAHRRSDDWPSPYSSEGFDMKTSGQASHPTASAPADEAPSLFGLVAAGTFSGSVTRGNGTSASTALATRLAAARTSSADPRAAVIAVAQANEGALPPPPDGVSFGPRRWGAGRITAAGVPGIPPRRER